MYQSNDRAYIINPGDWDNGYCVTHNVLWAEINNPLPLPSKVNSWPEVPNVPDSGSISGELYKPWNGIGSTLINGANNDPTWQPPPKPDPKPTSPPTRPLGNLPLSSNIPPSPKRSGRTVRWLVFVVLATLMTIFLGAVMFLIPNVQRPILSSVISPSHQITYSTLTVNATSTPDTLYVALFPTPLYIPPLRSTSTSDEILQPTEPPNTPTTVPPSFTPTLLPTSTPTSIPASPTRVPPTETSLPTLPPILFKPTTVDEVEPFIYVVTSSIIIRPAPGNRTKSNGEIQKGTSLIIVGYTYVTPEKLIWWRVKIDDRSFGWVVNNPSLINVLFVTFDKNGLPTNVQPAK